MNNNLGDINFTDYLSDDEPICYDNNKEFKNNNNIKNNNKHVINSIDNDFMSLDETEENKKIITNIFDDTFIVAQYKFNQLEIKKKYDILEEVSKVYKSIFNIFNWYKSVINKIENELDDFSKDYNIQKLNQTTFSISNMIKVLFIKNYDVHSLFIINTDDDIKKGYYISQNYNKMLTTNKNLDIKFYYIDSIKFYDIQDNIFKLSIFNENLKEYILTIGDNFNIATDNFDLYQMINKLYNNIEEYKNYFKLKYSDVISVMNSIAILIQNY